MKTQWKIVLGVVLGISMLVGLGNTQVQGATNQVSKCEVNLSIRDYTQKTPLKNPCENGISFYTKIDTKGIKIYRQIGKERAEIGLKGTFILRDKNTGERTRIIYRVTDSPAYLEQMKKKYKSNPKALADIEAVELLQEEQRKKLKKDQSKTSKEDAKAEKVTLKKQQEKVDKALQELQEKKRDIRRYSVEELKELQKQGKLEFTDVGSYVYEVRIVDENVVQEIDKNTAQELGYVDSVGEVLPKKKEQKKVDKSEKKEEKGLSQGTKNTIAILLVLGCIFGVIVVLNRKIQKV